MLSRTKRARGRLPAIFSVLAGSLACAVTYGGDERGDASAPPIHMRMEARPIDAALHWYQLFQEICWASRGKSDAEIAALIRPMDRKTADAFIWARRDGFYTAEAASIETTTQFLAGDDDDPECLPKLVRTYEIKLMSWCGEEGRATTSAKPSRRDKQLPAVASTETRESERHDGRCPPPDKNLSSEVPVSTIAGIPCVWSGDLIAAALMPIAGAASAPTHPADWRQRESDACVWSEHYGHYPDDVFVAMPNMLSTGPDGARQSLTYEPVALRPPPKLDPRFFTLDAARARSLGPVVLPVTLEHASMRDRK